MIKTCKSSKTSTVTKYLQILLKDVTSQTVLYHPSIKRLSDPSSDVTVDRMWCESTRSPRDASHHSRRDDMHCLFLRSPTGVASRPVYVQLFICIPARFVDPGCSRARVIIFQRPHTAEVNLSSAHCLHHTMWLCNPDALLQCQSYTHYAPWLYRLEMWLEVTFKCM